MDLKKENLLKELLERATNAKSSDTDEVAVEFFCSVLRDNPQLTQKAKEMIFEKMRSQNEIEATKSVALLEECMNSGCVEFQTEMGKKRSLNVLSGLVLTSHEGENTAFETKKRILQCLQVWSVNFPEKENIRIVYDNLSEKSVIDLGEVTTIAKRRNMLDIDEKELSKLLKSKNPQDFEKANLLIVQGVHQEAIRTELMRQEEMRRIESQRQLYALLEEIKNTASLLNQMLDNYETESICNNAANIGATDAMRDLYNVCRELRIKLKSDFNEIVDETLIANIVRGNDSLQEVLQRYKTVVIRTKVLQIPSPAMTAAAEIASQQMTATIIDAILPPSTLRTHKGGTKSANKTFNAEPTDLLAELTNDDLLAASALNKKVAALLPNTSSAMKRQNTTTTNNITDNMTNAAIGNPLDELNDIFRNIPTTTTSTTNLQNNDIFNLELLQPVKIADEFKLDADEFKMDIATSNSNSNLHDLRSIRNLPEIDELSEKLFKQNLISNDRIGSFKKDPEKLTLNELKKDNLNKLWQLPTNDSATSSMETTPTKLEGKKQTELNAQFEIESNGLMTEIFNATEQNKNEEQQPQPIEQNRIESGGIKHLSEIKMDLDDILPTLEQRLVFDDDDVKITLQFTSNRPLQYVTTFVLVVHNKSKLSVKDYHLEGSVKKPCKVRLLPSTSNFMKPFKPFSPETPIYQIVLLSNPTGHSVDLSCIIGYKLGDDPDPIKESIVIKDLPFVE